MEERIGTVQGTAGLQTQVPGQAATVSGAASATGGITAGNFIESDIESFLYRFRGDETPLMCLMHNAKKVKVSSPVVDHYSLDEQRFSVTVGTRMPSSSQPQSVLMVRAADQTMARPGTTLLAKDVDGYDETGSHLLPGSGLMLYVVGYDKATNNPIVRAVNGPRNSPTDAFCTMPEIPKNTVFSVLGNALYETQKEVDPDLVIPRKKTVYLQKRGLNHVVSDYFEAQKKRIPFSKALIAEEALINFKRKSNRTLWASRGGMFSVEVPKMGIQTVYCTEGIRWQIGKQYRHSGKWTIEKIIALAKMFYTGEDVPKSALLLAGKNLLEQLQCIDYSKHPEIRISKETNKSGWEVTRLTTVFGDIDIKREPALDSLGWSSSGALLGEDRLVHYTYSQEHSFEDKVEGEEATRSGLLVWDALALKGNCHIWIDGDGDCRAYCDLDFQMWDSAEAPTTYNHQDVFLLLEDCPGISADAKAGQLWQVFTGTDAELRPIVTWKKYTGEITIR